MNLSKSKSRLSTTFGIGTLVATALLCSGCDQLAGAIMEQAVVRSAPEDGKRDSFAARFKKVQAECPKKINDYTTLQYVKMNGLNRVEYRYLVSESGREIVNMNYTIPHEYEYTLMTKNSPLYDSIMKLDMSVDHIFRDADDKQMLSVHVNKRALKAIDRPRPLFCYHPAMMEAHGIEVEPAESAEGTPVEEIATEEKKADENEEAEEKSFVAVSPVEEFPTVLEEEKEEVKLPTAWPTRLRTPDNPAGVQINPYAN